MVPAEVKPDGGVVLGGRAIEDESESAVFALLEEENDGSAEEGIGQRPDGQIESEAVGKVS